jgi:alanyl-tRNA synthetase
MPDFPSTRVPKDARIAALPADEIRRRFLAFFAERGHEVVPSASLVPAGDQTLLFTNSGMVQFKDVLTGRETRSYARAVDAQRCLRVAGKHNDFEEVGRSPRHHTLFEMLGNWSFGDYFKRDAIHWAWELLTREFGIPADRLAATVYTFDDEAYAIWRDEIGLPPERIARWGNVEEGDEKNYWRMAETGPCGPCSEIHFDRGAELSEGEDCTPDHSEQCPRWAEIWNLVFMEFEQQPDGPRVPLPFTSVDTGLGLERLAAVLQQVPTNYDTDLFTPIHARMRDLLGHDPDAFEAERFSYQVIADHSRAITFLVADGVLPSNEGRGYVLRRILRRAVRHGRLLGRREPFLDQTATVVIDLMVGAYPYLGPEREHILKVIRREEALFARTLDAGTAQLETALAALPGVVMGSRTVGRRPEMLPNDAPTLDGGFAFRLHDTYGFPIDLTVELAAEYGVGVDREGFEASLSDQRVRSRAGTRGQLSRLALETSLYEAILRRQGEVAFFGYETTATDGRVVALVRGGVDYQALDQPGPAEVVLDQTPFYAEGGGQIGDRGVLSVGAEPAFRVDDTQRPVGQLIVHRGEVLRPLRVGEQLRATVDAGRRAATMRNHTATHLLHRALRNAVGNQARQAGSRVSPHDLRFDFPLDRPLAPEEMRAIEAEVRAIIRDDRPVSVAYLGMAEAVALGADAFFDEKYGETVRTVAVRDYSRELCGGTHCQATGQIGGFIITAERSIGSGMRRIEALTGAAADAYVAERLVHLDEVATALGAPSSLAVAARVAELQSRVAELEKRLRAGAVASIPRPREAVDGAETVGVARLVALGGRFGSAEELKAWARDVRGLLGSGVIAVGLRADEPQLFVTVSEDLVARGVSAAALVQAAVPALDGRGGGRPEMAQGRGSRPEGLDEALRIVRQAVANALAAAPDTGG